MRLFKDKDGRILQLADKEKINSWSPEVPLIFIGDIKDKRIPIYKNQYSSDLVKEIESYLDEILQDVAIPKLINALNSSDRELRLQVAQNFLQVSQSNADMLKIALDHIKNAINEEKSKDIVSILKDVLKNYEKAQKKKQTAKKRAKLRKLSRKMSELDRDYADGKISDKAYLDQRKEFVKLQREIELAEAVD